MILIKSSLSIALLFCLCSCTVLKNKKESKTEQASEFKQGSQSVTSTVDSSKKITTERLKVTYYPAAGNQFPDLDLPVFAPDLISNLTGMSADQQKAITNMQANYKSLQGNYTKLAAAYKSAKGITPPGAGLNDKLPPLGKITLEYEGTRQENNHLSSSESKQDSVIKNDTSRQEDLETKKVNDWAKVGMVALFALFFLYLIWKR